MTNPLITPFLLPPFSKIQPNHIVPAIKKALNDCYLTIETIITDDNKTYTWNNLCQKIMEVDDILERIFSLVTHLNSVRNSLELREVYEQTIPLVTNYSTWISQNKALYKAYCNLHDNENYITLNTEQKKAVDNTLRDFKLAGINLSQKKKKRYAEISVRLSELSNKYSNNVLDATIGWSKLISNKDELTGVPKRALATMKEKARENGWDGYLLSLDIPSYLPVITYCDNQALRKEIYYAYNTRASDQGPNAAKWDNSSIIAEILVLRYELAQLLGYKNYVYKSLVTKMVQNPKQVVDFLTDLTELIRPQGEKELIQLHNFVKSKFGVEKLEFWDISYYSEKQKKYLYNINDEQLRSYFPENRILNGLFNIVERIYGIRIKERYGIDTWHPEVRFFDLYDENSELRGSFYLDLYVRKNKRCGAWMDNCVNQMRKIDGTLQKPVAYLICNFNPPVNNEPALFTHDEVITLFHEFGHGLHHILTNIETPSVAGINGVPWDAIELPSQFMENWCWEPDVLMMISGHYKTGEPLPKTLLNNILATKNYQIAMFLLRQLECSLFDFHLHMDFKPGQEVNIINTITEVKNKVLVIPSPAWGRFSHVFSHIFAGGYAAGYYSYLWSNVMALDAFFYFKKKGIFNREIGQSFLVNILTRGGSEDPMEMFKRFRGREPKLDAILEYYGITR